MVVGLDIFTEHFKSHTEQYLLIGGGACDQHFQKRGLNFRATKDLDIILIVEALSNDFVNHFWEFIKEGEYSIAEISNKKQFYRFIYPKAPGYPKMIELFSRKPDSIIIPEGFHLTDIPTDEDVSSLSAILLDDDYYNFTLANTILSDGLHHANDIALIVLKAKAFLNNRKRKEEGQKVQEDDIEKHRRDVIRLIATLAGDAKVEAPEVIRRDLRDYVNIIRDQNPDIEPLMKKLGVNNVTLEHILEQLAYTFNLSEI
jgi:hypothetical protein